MKMEDLAALPLEAVAAVDENWGLGYRGQLLAHVSPDMKRFRSLTLGQRVIYGRKTLATFPKGRPLPGRENVLLTRDTAWHRPSDWETDRETSLQVAHSLDELAQLLAEKQLSGDDKRNFVIGGAEVYDQLLPWCRRVHLTRLHKSFTADCFFPDLDALADWYLAGAQEPQEWQGLTYSFLTYQLRSK